MNMALENCDFSLKYPKSTLKKSTLGDEVLFTVLILA